MLEIIRADVGVYAEHGAKAVTDVQKVLHRGQQTGEFRAFDTRVMALVEQLCDRVAVVAAGKVVASGTVSEVRAVGSLEDAFVALVGASTRGSEGLSWLSH